MSVLSLLKKPLAVLRSTLYILINPYSSVKLRWFIQFPSLLNTGLSFISIISLKFHIQRYNFLEVRFPISLKMCAMVEEQHLTQYCDFLKIKNCSKENLHRENRETAMATVCFE